MSKPKIAFLDHPFHRKTRSSHFFADLLSETFEVHTFYVPDDPRAIMQEIGDSSYDIVVCWQTEVCAPYLLMRGKRVVCIPMYDGVANVPAWYWMTMRQARFISFSKKLHERLRGLGIESYYFQYYSKKNVNVPRASFFGLRGFFWQRRPEEGLDYSWARSVLGQAVPSLHVHNAPDNERPEDWQPDSMCTVTEYGEDSSAYLAALEQANVYICPRRTEGIGMALIEAMARGMCVIAHNEPTANEYLVDGVNGLLVDYDNPKPFVDWLPMSTDDKSSFLSPELAARLGEQAHRSYVNGLKKWEEESKSIPILVRGAPSADLSKKEQSFLDDYLYIAKYARLDFPRYLHRLMQLHHKGMLGEEMSAISLRETWKRRVAAVPGVRPLYHAVRRLLRM